MRLGLYSEAARTDVVAARALLHEHQIPPTDDGIRRARELLLALPAEHPAHPVVFGMRGPRNDRQVFDTYREKGVSVYTARRMREMGVAAACAEAIPRATDGMARTWISLDMDVLDIGALHDWGDEPLGLSGHDVVEVVHEAARAGADVLAMQFVAPDSPAAARLAVYIAVYMMAGLVEGGHLPKPR